MGLFDGMIWRAKKKKFFYERVEWFKIGNHSASFEWNSLEGGMYRWYNPSHYDFLKSALQFENSSSAKFWWAYNEIFRRREMNYQRSNIQLKFELK